MNPPYLKILLPAPHAIRSRGEGEGSAYGKFHRLLEVPGKPLFLSLHLEWMQGRKKINHISPGKGSKVAHNPTGGLQLAL